MSFKKINLTRAKKLKNHLFLCAVFYFLFFISSCTKEDFTEEIKEEVTSTPNSITGKHYQGKEAFNFVNEKKLNEIIGSGQFRDEYAFTIDYSEVIQVIGENIGENITIRVNHPNQKPFMFYNLVISTSLNGTTARLLEYTMTPRFFNSYSSGLTTIQEFEGLVLSQLMYTSYLCEDEEDEMLIIAPYGDYNLVDPTTGTTSGINLINTGFLSGSYSGTMFSGPSPASPGSGGENDPSTFPNFTDGLGNFFNSVGSVFSDAYEWTGNTIRTIFRWIRNLFCGSCSPRFSMARGPGDPIIIIDDDAPPATTPAPLEPCDWFYTNFALFQVNILVGYNPNNDLTPEVLNWWDTVASDPVKVSLLNYLFRYQPVSQSRWVIFFQLVDYKKNGGNEIFLNELLKLLNQNQITFISNLNEITEYLNNEQYDPLAVQDALLTFVTKNSDTPWTPNTGCYNNVPTLCYSHTRTVYRNNRPLYQYKLLNGDIISSGDYSPPGEGIVMIETYYWSQSDPMNWYRIPEPTTYSHLSLDFLFNQFWSFVQTGVRICTPLEEIVVLIDGKDFDGVAQSKAAAGIFVLIDITPVGKVTNITRRAGHTLSSVSPVVAKVLTALEKSQRNLRKQYTNIISTMNSTRKGNFGEICTDVDFFEKGYEVLHTNRITNIDQAGHQGIDHIFKNPQTGEFVIVESKFHGSGGLTTLPNGIRQMSDSWISNGQQIIQIDYGLL